MGGGTWVYIGTFSFDRGCNPFNRVVVTNHSHHKGVVTSDAIRFGGGMGNINRGGIKSGLPRCVEGARYTAQWSGAPYSVYGGKSGEDDYADDINSRSHMVNWMAGGSVLCTNYRRVESSFRAFFWPYTAMLAMQKISIRLLVRLLFTQQIIMTVD